MKFRKIIGVILAISCFINCTIPASASVFYSDSPQYELSEDATEIISKHEYRRISNNDKMFVSETGDYALEIADGVLLPVGRLDVDLSIDTEVQDFLARTDILGEGKEEVAKVYSTCKEAGIAPPTITVYSPNLLGGPDSTIRYKYGGSDMLAEIYEYKNLDTGAETVVTGVDTFAVASTLSSIMLSWVGVKSSDSNDDRSVSASVVLALIGSGKALIDYFYAKYKDSIIETSTKDYIEIGIKYNKREEFVYLDQGESAPQRYLLGLVAQEIEAYEVTIKQYYYNPNTRTGQSVTNTKVYQSGEGVQPTEHFENPWEFAFRHAGGAPRERVRWKAHDKTFLF